MLTQLIKIFAVSLIATFLLLPCLSVLARRVGLLDYPDSKRKVHNTPKPLVGGVGMIISSALACLLIMPLSNLTG